MGKYDGYLLCSDLDGTFLGAEGNLPEENIAAVRRFCAEGGLFTFCTGRAVYYMEEHFLNRVPINTNLICLNGTILYDPDTQRILFRRTLEKEQIREMDFWAKQLGGVDHVLYHSFAVSYTSFSEIPQEQAVHKIVFYMESVQETKRFRKEMTARFGEKFTFNESWETGFELLPKGGGKGEAIREMRRLLGDRVKTVVAVGDYENDIPMIREADIGYAVENALEEVKAAADRITVSHREAAIARIIEEL